MTREWEEALHHGSIDILEFLLEAGAEIDARDAHGQTSVMLAALDGQAHVVRWLVVHGAALDHTAKYNLSALMLAVIRGHAGVVRELTSAGANLKLRGTGAPGFSGKTALDLAVAHGNSEIIEILRAAEKTL